MSGEAELYRCHRLSDRSGRGPSSVPRWSRCWCWRWPVGCSGGTAGARRRPPPPATGWLPPAPAPSGRRLSSTGTIEPAVQDSLNFAVSGRVTSVAVDGRAEGDGRHGAGDGGLGRAEGQRGSGSRGAGHRSGQAGSRQRAGGTTTQLAADSASVAAAQGQLSLGAGGADQRVADLADHRGGGERRLGGRPAGQRLGGYRVGRLRLRFGLRLDRVRAAGSRPGPATTPAARRSSSSGSAAQFTVLSTDSWIVNATVDDTQVGLLATGDQAQLSISGASSRSSGRSARSA